MIRSIIIAALTIGLIGIGYWGYQEHEEKNQLLIHAENTYQRSFHELSYHMDLLNDKIGTSLAMNSGEKLSPQFVDIWRLSSKALGNVGQLPLSLLPFHETEQFLSDIGDFTYKTAVRNLDDDPLTDKEIKTLEQLYNQSEEIKDELREVQYEALDNNLRWMDVELALATQDNMEDNSIIDGFQTVENKVDGFSSDNEADGIMNNVEADGSFQYLKGDWKDEQDIKQFAKKLFSIKDDGNLKLTKTGKGADVPMFSVSYEDGKSVYMDITQKGAHPVNIIVHREVGDKQISLNDGLLKAEEYLKNFDYKEMHAFQSQQFDNVGVFSFTYTEDDVRVLPDTIVVKVALDNGEIMGLNAESYLQNHHDRDMEEPTLSLDEAKKEVNSELEIQEEHLAIIENDIEDEVLTYEFLGTIDDETYRIFINAENGNEEKVEKLTGTETNFEASL